MTLLPALRLFHPHPKHAHNADCAKPKRPSWTLKKRAPQLRTVCKAATQVKRHKADRDVHQAIK